MLQFIPIKEIIGRKITNIFQVVEFETGGLDKGECYIQLDNDTMIEIPWSCSDEVEIVQLNKNAKSLFADLSDYPVYHINEAGKSISDIAKVHQKEKQGVFSVIDHFFLGIKPVVDEYKPYRVEYVENPLKHIKDKYIVNFIFFVEDDFEKGFLELDNGFVISETNVANNGTGKAGLNLYATVNEIPGWDKGILKRKL